MASLIPNLSTCRKIGFIVPSSNTLVEPTCNAILHTLNTSRSHSPEILALYTRLPVQTLGTDAASTSQFSASRLAAAASLLADAECEAVLWNGTSGMWTGSTLADDEALAAAMTEACGGRVACSTTTLAAVAALRELGVRRLGVAVPYDEVLMGRVAGFFEREVGVEVVRAARMEETPRGNAEIAKVGAEGVREVVVRACEEGEGGERAQAVVVACTNWRGAEVVGEVEKEFKGMVTVVDSITVTIWMALRMIGGTGGVRGWGRLMEKV